MKQRTRILMLVLGTGLTGSCRGIPDAGPAKGGERFPILRTPAEGTGAPTLDFSELYIFGPRAPAPTAKLLELDGKQVTLMGYMVQMEHLAPRGSFYLAPYPAFCDESGAGRGGLPPASILVRPHDARGKEMEFMDGALELTGTLEVGNHLDEDGEVSTVRLHLRDMVKIRAASLSSAARTAELNGKGNRQ